MQTSRRICVYRPRVESLEDRIVLTAPTQWQSVGTGGGGALFSPSWNPANGDDLFIASDMGQLFHSTDRGASWSAVDYREIQASHESQVQFTNDPNMSYALDFTNIDGGDAIRPSKSTDGGVTWTLLANDPTAAGAFYLYADVNNSNRLLISDYTTLYFSNDGGATWNNKYTTGNNAAGLRVGGAFFDGANIYVGTIDGLLVSNNNGATFGLASVGGIPNGQAIASLAGAKTGGVTRLAVVANNGVYAGMQGWDKDGYTGVYTWDVGQPNWTLHTTGIPGTSQPFFIGMATNDINTMYVGGGSDAGEPTVYRTTNAGANWQSVFLTTNNQNIATGWQGAGGDRDWTYGELALGFAVSPSDPNRVVISDYGYAHYTTDGGTSWQQLYVNPADQNPAGQSTPQGKIYRSSGLDNTTAWQVTWADADHMIVSNSDIRGQISTDGGGSFSFNYTGHTLNSMYRAVVDPNSGRVYAATSSVHDMYQTTYLTDARIDGGSGRVLYSTNMGSTWQTLHDFGHPVVWVATDPTTPNRLYASVIHSTQGGIFVSNNIQNGGASTWTKLTNPPRTQGHPFNIVVLNDGTLVVTYSGRRTSNFTNSSGVFVSTDGGTSWQDRSDPGMLYYTKDIVVDPHDPTQNTWYVGVWSGWGGAANGLGGLYKTTNRGVNWTRINTADRVTSLTINPSDPDEAYMTTETEGLLYTNDLTAPTPTFSPDANYPFRQPERVFFNPFDPNEIWVTNFGNGIRVGTISSSPGSLQFSQASYNVTENGVQATITVTRTGGSTGAVQVNYNTTDGSATDGNDYTGTSGTLSWADGDAAAKTFTVSIQDDPTDEIDETVNLTLSFPTNGATLGTPNVAVLTITDNDAAPSLSINDVSVTEGDGGTVDATFTVTLSPASSKTVTVDFTAAGGSALLGADFNPSNGTLTFLPGILTQSVTVHVNGDILDEINEDYFVNLLNPTNATVGDNQGKGTITDDDLPPTLSIDDKSVSEGDAGTVNMTFTVLLSAASGKTITVDWNTVNDTAASPADFTNNFGTLTFNPGTTSLPVVIQIKGDTLDESDEAFFVNLTNASNAGIADGQAQGTITDDDTAGTVQFSLSDYAVTETGGVATVTVTRTGGVASGVTVQWAATDGSATDGQDFQAAAGTLTFNAGDASKTFQITILDDGFVETLEAINLTLSNVTGGAALGAPNTATITITDDDTVGIIITGATGVFTTEGGGTATFMVMLSALPSADVSIDLTGSDLTEGTVSLAQLVFTPLNALTPQLVTITGVDDFTLDDNQKYTIIIGAALSADLGFNGIDPPDVPVINVEFLPNGLRSYVDQDGDNYTVRLKGLGKVGVILNDPDDDGDGAVERIILVGTDPLKSKLGVTAKNAHVDIGAIQGDGVKAITLKTSDLVGEGVKLTGFLGKLSVRDILNGADMIAEGTPLQKTNIKAHDIQDGTTIDIGANINSLKAARFGSGTIVAPSLGTLQITGDVLHAIPGDFAANVTLTGTVGLKSMKVAGTVSGIQFTSVASVGSIQVGKVVDSLFQIGYQGPADGSGVFTPGIRLHSFKAGSPFLFGPAFTNSSILAPIIDSVFLTSVLTANGGNSFGVIADDVIGAVTISNPVFAYDLAQPTPQGMGDFQVVVV